MRSLSRLLLVVGLLSVVPLSIARAGSVSIYASPEGPGTTYGLYVQNSLGFDVGAVDVLVQGSTAFTPDPANLAISVADTVYLEDVFANTATLVVNGTLGSPAPLFAAIAPAGATTRLGTLTGSSLLLLPGETLDPDGSGEPVFAASFFDVQGGAITGEIAPLVCGDPDCFVRGFTVTVPEPLALPLAASLALVAHVLGGKIRRRSGSVGAPT